MVGGQPGQGDFHSNYAPILQDSQKSYPGNPSEVLSFKVSQLLIGFGVFFLGVSTV